MNREEQENEHLEDEIAEHDEEAKDRLIEKIINEGEDNAKN